MLELNSARWQRRGATLLLSVTLLFSAQNSADVAHAIAADLRAGQIDQAKQLLAAALKSSPQDARLWTLNGLAIAASGDPITALKSYQHALALSPDYYPALEGAAEIEYNRHDPEAVPVLKRILKQRPDDQTARGMLATLALERGDCETAENELHALRPAGSTDFAAEREFGACLVRQKRVRDALPVFEQLLASQPGNAAARSDLAAAQFLAGDYRATVATLTPALDSRTANPGALDLLAQANEMLGATDRALALLEQAIAASPGTPQYYADYAYICLSHGKFQAGLERVNAGLERLPQVASLYVARGVLRSELAQYEQGEEDFRRAEQLDPHVELGSAGRGLAELQRNDLPQAEATVRKDLRAEPKNAFLHYLLAEVLVRKGASAGTPEFTEAIQAAQRAVDLNPNMTLARNTLGELYLQAGRPHEAIEQFQSALHADPNDEKALYHLILALRRADQKEEVPALLKRLVALRAQHRGQQDLGEKFSSADQAANTGAEPPH